MESTDQGGTAAAKQTHTTTWFLTNSPQADNMFNNRCHGGHRHVHLVNAKTRATDVYPAQRSLAALRATIVKPCEAEEAMEVELGTAE